MDKVQTQLESLCREVERQLKAKLRTEVGALVKEYLPQAWVFETELGSCTVYIDGEGNARVWRGADKERDLTLQWRCDALVRALESKDGLSVEPEEYPNVFVQTDKGRAAFNYLRKEFGL